MSSTGRHYPLREEIAQAWNETGVEPLPKYDGNAGHPLGRAELNENRRHGLRQLASSVYPLGGIHVLTETLVKRVILSTDANGGVKATGIETANGTRYAAKEVIVSAGSYRTPRLLMLSGIGPEDTLSKLGITPVVASDQVGKNLHDHLEFAQYWKLKDPSAGYAVGSSNPLFSQPQFGTGVPVDWAVTTTVPKEGLIKLSRQTTRAGRRIRIPILSSRPRDLSWNPSSCMRQGVRLTLMSPQTERTSCQPWCISCLPPRAR